MGFIEKIFGTKNDRDLKKIIPRVVEVNELEERIAKRSDRELSSRIAELKAEVIRSLARDRTGTLTKDRVNEVLDPLLPETFAIVREASKRVLGMRHYDVQLIGGMALHDGRIAEMKTGEGKTLVATLPAVLNALTGDAVHVVTVNDYLASRDAEWMGRIYRFLGLSVGVVVNRQGDRAKKEAYEANITYGQNNEFGFDYLRDNMKFSLLDYKQRGHGFAIVDEVDSILIDEARTPLIISGAAEDNTPQYIKANGVVPMLRKDEHYAIDEKARSVLLTETGVARVESVLGIENLYEPTQIEILHHISQALKAHTLYKRDTDYVVEAGEVVIVDEHTGRLMPGRRWSDGLHGAIEAKENVRIQAESQTLATISFQNLFRMYRKLSGMTGTADTEAEEFHKIYGLDVLVIPTNRAIKRLDEQDQIYKTEGEKFQAVVEDIVFHHEKGAPILVGTTSVEKSEVLSKFLRKKGIQHNILNAKQHRAEADIVAQAGQLGQVTIATNMAGRGTDILLGGNPEFKARTEVATMMGRHEGQVAEFAFLSGRPDLINIEKLAARDKLDAKFIQEWEERVQELRDEAEEKGEAFVMPAEMPQTIDEMRDRVYAERLEFYQQAVARYSERLPVYEEHCSVEKEKVRSAGGLRIIGTERHESRRIDNQLRGRAGRQGDPGSSRFYLSLEDDLMRIFGTDRMIRLMEALGMEEGVPIEHKMVTKSIEGAQKRVEGMHFDSRKNLIEYDDVMNQQRKAVYALRRQILDADPSREVEAGGTPPDPIGIHEMVLDLVESAVVQRTTLYLPEKAPPGEWKLTQLEKDVAELMITTVDLGRTGNSRDDVMDLAFNGAKRTWEKKADQYGLKLLGQLSAYLYLSTIDQRWKEHLQHMDHLREGIHMRSYGQRDPKQEYKKEGFAMYQAMRATIRDEVLDKLFHAQISVDRSVSTAEMNRLRKQQERQAKKRAKQDGGAKKVIGVDAPMTTSSSSSTSSAAASSGTAMPRIGGASSVAAPPARFPATSSPFAPSSSASPSGAAAPPPSLRRPSPADDSELNRAQRRRQKAKSKTRVRLK